MIVRSDHLKSRQDDAQLHLCVVTGTRADYGVMRSFIRDVQADPFFKLSLLVTGSHLSTEFGCTLTEIQDDGIEVAQKVEMLISSDTTTAQAKSLGLGIIGYTDALNVIDPDYILILGDRYEMLGVASTALILNIPIIHLHGGELSFGVIDEAVRHSITKMAELHFVSTEAYRKRVIQLGENPERVFYVGSLGVENMNEFELPARHDLLCELGLPIEQECIVITYHPDSSHNVEQYINALLLVLDHYSDYTLVFTMPNVDAGYARIKNAIELFMQERSNVFVFNSLGQQRYFGLVAHAIAVIGNSSSGIIEVPSFGIPTVNIGDRQAGRIAADSVITCIAQRDDIEKAPIQALSPEFRSTCRRTLNPYFKQDCRKNIMNIIKEQSKTQCGAMKVFYDVN